MVVLLVKTKSKPDTYVVVDGVRVERFMEASYDSVEYADVNLFYLNGFRPYCDGDVSCEFPNGLEDLKDLLDEMMVVGNNPEAWDVMFDDVWRKSHSALARTVLGLEKAYRKVRSDVDKIGGVQVGYWDALDVLVVDVRDMVVADSKEMSRRGKTKAIWRIGLDQMKVGTLASKNVALSEARYLDAFIGSVFRKLYQIEKLEAVIEATVKTRLGVFDMGQLGRYEEMKADNWDRAFKNLSRNQNRKLNGRYTSDK